LASITEAATGRLNTRLDRAAVAEERITPDLCRRKHHRGNCIPRRSVLAGPRYRETVSSEQMLQATLDSVREGVGAVDYRGHLRAWNSSLLAMLGVGGDNIRQGFRFLRPSPARASSAGGFAESKRRRRRQTSRCWRLWARAFRRQSNSPNSPRRKPFSRR
jgi:PAS domain-containing protein